MPNHLIDEDTDLLAAEFVLGTLDSEERANAQSQLRSDHALIAMVRIWERRFGELHLMVEPVEPDPKIFDRIKAKLAISPPSEPAAAAGQPAETTASPEAPKAADVHAGVEAPTPDEELPKALMNGETSKAEEAAAQAEAPKTADGAPASDSSVRAVADIQPRLESRRAEATIDLIRGSRRRWRALGLFMSLVVIGLTALLAAWRFVPDRLPARLQPSQLMMSLGIQSAPPAPQPQPSPESQFDE